MSAINSALTGLVSAQTRLNVSANNTANARSTVSDDEATVPVNKPYQPQRVQDQTLATGGVRAVVLPDAPASVAVYDPASSVANEEGIVNYPNVSEENEVVNQIISSNSFQANLKTLKTADDALSTLLDIKE